MLLSLGNYVQECIGYMLIPLNLKPSLCCIIKFQYRSEGHKPYIIPPGGFSALGSWGYIDSWQEMVEQVGWLCPRL